MTKEKAEMKVHQLTGIKTSKWCPLSLAYCRADCESFVEGWISDNQEYCRNEEEIQYTPHGPYCNCVALKGK